MRKSGFLIILAAAALSAVFLMAGCGKTTSQMAVYSLSNQGVVQGYVYDLAASNAYAPKYVPVAGAAVAAGPLETTTDSSGYYKLSPVPAGESLITASKSGYIPLTIKADRNAVNFYLSGGSASGESGAAVISGTIHGLPPGVSTVYGQANSVLKSSGGFNYNSSLYQYAISNAPDDGDTWLFAYYSSNEAGNSRYFYAYKKINSTAGSKEVNLDFAASASYVTANIKNKTGYKADSLSVDLLSGYRTVQNNIYSGGATQEGAKTVNYLPALSADDLYSICASAYPQAANGISLIQLYKNSLASGSSAELDFSAVPDFAVRTPASGEYFTSNPVFVWDPIIDDAVAYCVYLYPSGSSNAIWAGITKSSSISVPDAVKLPNGSYEWKVEAFKLTNFDAADFYPASAQSYVNWRITSALRGVAYAKP